MGTVELFLVVSFLGCFAHAQLMPENAVFSQMFFERIPPYPFEQPFDLLSYPDFSLLNEVPPFMRIPKVQVFCDHSQFSLLVDRTFNGGILDAAQIELGDGCYSNGRLPNQLVFIYSFDQCGTKQLQQHGLDVFSNVLHFHPKEISFTWWTPPTVQVTCVPKRSGPNPYFLVPAAPLVHGRNFNMKTMNPPLSNVFERGQLISFQVFANTKPGEQLFIQSCHVLMSPNPHSKPKLAVIFNKGCTANLQAAPALVHFVASHRLDVVNFAVNTSYLASGVYMRCSLLVSEQGVASGSKSCNYNFKSSRWEELSGNMKVCQCCNSMCRGISLGHLPYDARGIVTTGPFLIVDKHAETKMSHNTPEADDTQSAVTSALTDINHSPSLPGVTQDVHQPQNDFYSNTMSDAPWPSSTDNEVLMIENNNGPHGETGLKSGRLMKGVDVLALFDGWVIHPGKEAFERNSHRNVRSHKESLKVIDLPHASSKRKIQTDLVEIQQQETNEMEPVIRSKLQLSSLDGTQMLTYEVIEGSLGMNRARKCKKSLLNLLDLLRKMDKAE